MATKDNVQIAVIRGKIQYPKIFEPVLNYAGDGKEWIFDLELVDKNSVKEIKDLGIGDRVKQKEAYLEGKPHLTFKQNVLRKDGSPNREITVEDAAGNKWDPSRLIGNDSVVDVKFKVIDNGKGKFAGVYPMSIRVLDYLPYVRKEFDALTEEDPYYAKAVEAQERAKSLEDVKTVFGANRVKDIPERSDEELNDDIPV